MTEDMWASPDSFEHLPNGFHGVIGFACEQMVAPKRFEIRVVRPQAFAEGAIRLELETASLDSLTFLLDNFRALSTAVEGSSRQSLSIPPANSPNPSRLAVLGPVAYPGKNRADHILAASLNFDLAQARPDGSPLPAGTSCPAIAFSAPLGKGGMGEVYRLVALKFLPADSLTDQDKH